MTTKQIPWFEVKESQLKDAGWGLYALQDFDKFDCIGIYSGFESINYISNTSNTFAIFERVKEITYDCYPWPNYKNCNGNGIHLACDVHWKRYNSTKHSNLWNTGLGEEEKFENNIIFRDNFGGECTNTIAKHEEILMNYNID